MGSEQVFARMPPYGRWSIQLGAQGWPKDQPLPTSAEVKVITAAKVCSANYNLETDIVPAVNITDASNNDRAVVGNLGAVCGGKGFDLQRSANTVQEEEPNLFDEFLESSWGIPSLSGFGVGILVSIMTALAIHRVRKKWGSTPVSTTDEIAVTATENKSA